MNRLSFQMRLVAGFMLVITLALASVLFGASALIRDRMISAKEQELIRKGKDIAHRIHLAKKNNTSPTRLNTILNDMDNYLDARIWVLDASRRLVDASGRQGMGMGPGGMGGGRKGAGGMNGALHNSTEHDSPGMGLLRSVLFNLDPVYQGEVRSQLIDHPYYEEKMVVVAVPIVLPDGKIDGAVLLNAPVAAVNDFMSHIYVFVGFGAVIGIFLSFLVVRLFTRSLVRPLRAMQETAAAIAQGNYTARVEVKSQDEIGKLGQTINGLAQDLGHFMVEVGKTEKLRRDFIANVSHELRTPLTVIRGYIEAMLDGIIQKPDQVKQYQSLIKTETIRLERLIQDLLTLGSLQSSGSACPLSFVALDEAAEHVLKLILPLAQAKNIRLHADIAPGLPLVQGNRDRLIQLFLIFLDNAVKYTPSGGSVTLSLATNKTDTLVCTIQDTGAGIPAEDLPYIWERFYKVDKSHQQGDGGTGLGLAIARQIIDRHNANVEISSEVGSGTVIQLTFSTLAPVFA